MKKIQMQKGELMNLDNIFIKIREKLTLLT